MTYRVRITHLTSREVQRRHAEMAVRSRQTADRWRDGLLAAIASLSANPERCPEAPETEWCGSEIRELFFGKRRNTYRILFTIRGETVYVVRVRHGRQDFLTSDELGSLPADESEP